MGAGHQRWWRSYDKECEEWSLRDVVYRFTTVDGTTVTLYKDGHRVYEHDGLSAHLRLWS